MLMTFSTAFLPSALTYSTGTGMIIESTMVGLAITDHSGLYLRVGVADGSNGGDPWDTAFIGWAFATADTLPPPCRRGPAAPTRVC